jgi:hypothetical protein
MFRLLKYFGYFTQAKQVYQKPEEFLSDISFGLVQGYFTIVFIINLAVIGLSIWLGFFEDILFFKITTFVFIISLIVVIVIYRAIHRFIQKISLHVTKRAKDRLHRKSPIDVEVK